MRIFKRALLVLFVLIAGIIVYNYPKLNIISGYAAKNMASTVFVAKRTAESVTLDDNNVPLINLADTEVSQGQKVASASVFGLMTRQAVFRPGLGSVLTNGDYDINQEYLVPKRKAIRDTLPFPYGNMGKRDSLFENVDYPQLKTALDSAFARPHEKRTRTVLVVYKGHIIAEKYADGMTKDTPILGWSMTKSVLATLFGIMEYQGKIDISNFHPFNGQDDPRNSITLNHLLRMQSGLAWDEDYSSISDVNRMLFLDYDMALTQAKKEVIAKPTEIWNYSSGTTNYLSGVLRKQFSDDQEYLNFPYSQLIDRIGMSSMLMETDLAGNFVGSSYAWANTRDWAKFGLLYLNQGHWNGDQIFSPEWVSYVTKPTEMSDGDYGAHFWLNAGGKYPDVPLDTYSANGFQGQRVFIIPSKELVVVRTGLAEAPEFDFNQFLKDILLAIQ